MNYGLWISASGLATSMYRMDVAANNLANVESVGFKADYAMAKQRDAARAEDGLSLPSNKMLEKLGAGALLAPNRPTTAQGQLERTGRPLDVGISGPGYLVVKTGASNRPEDLRLTRDGRLTLDNSGQLIHTASGKPVLDDAGQAIRMSGAGRVTIHPDGTIQQGAGVVGKLAFVTAGDPMNFRKSGTGLMQAPDGQMMRKQPAASAGGLIEQGSVEKSTVDPVRTMLDITSSERSIAYGTRIIQTIDESMQRAIGTFGRVA
ncbi:MAG: flagellar hook-basal body protein [Phycisphaerales bacterium]